MGHFYSTGHSMIAFEQPYSIRAAVTFVEARLDHRRFLLLSRELQVGSFVVSLADCHAAVEFHVICQDFRDKNHFWTEMYTSAPAMWRLQ